MNDHSFIPAAQPTSAALVPAAGSYTNPVLDKDFPDPALIHAPDGLYYAYATQTLRDGRWINIQVARSKNLVDWEHLGDALPEKPGWARETRISGRRASSSMARPTSCTIRQRPTSATNTQRGHCLAIATADFSGWAFRRYGHAAAAWAWASNISTRWRTTIRRRASACFTGDPGSNRSKCRSWPKIEFRSRREASRSISSGPIRPRGPSPTRRGRLGGPARRFLLPVLLRGQLLWTRRPLRRDGRALQKAGGPFETLEEAKGVPHSLMLFKTSAGWRRATIASSPTRLERSDPVSRDRREPAASKAGGRRKQPPNTAD